MAQRLHEVPGEATTHEQARQSLDVFIGVHCLRRVVNPLDNMSLHVVIDVSLLGKYANELFVLAFAELRAITLHHRVDDLAHDDAVHHNSSEHRHHDDGHLTHGGTTDITEAHRCKDGHNEVHACHPLIGRGLVQYAASAYPGGIRVRVQSSNEIPRAGKQVDGGQEEQKLAHNARPSIHTPSNDSRLLRNFLHRERHPADAHAGLDHPQQAHELLQPEDPDALTHAGGGRVRAHYQIQ
mmetsp:Transcript_70785/g.182541  ORF Transcript_70785/g.182541 Transcript_70785/m.182541 type:complete len:239 (+) Transcript_70785:1085-1801(+)